jgi:ion channel POLLUX/CASTOR
MHQRDRSLRERLRYRFDNALSAGIGPILIWLAVLSLVLIFVCAAILLLGGIEFNEERLSLAEAVWQAFVRTLDPGVIGADFGWQFRTVALLVTLGGLFIVSTLIGLIANGISDKLDELRKGRTPVLETDHILILGWSPKLLTVVEELMIANENQPGSRVVVMAQEDKVFMEDEIRTRVSFNKHTKVICRTGQPADPLDLALVDPMSSRAVIVLNPEQDSGDAQVIKTVLALMSIDPGLEKLSVVAEMVDERHAAALRSTTGGRVLTVVSSDVIARITAQVCRQSGLSVVYQELLDFDGDEIYFAAPDGLAGMTFGDALLAFETSAVIGARFADGRIALRPSMDTVMAAGDRVIAISEDDDTVVMAPEIRYPFEGRADLQPMELDRESILVVGWNSLGPKILEQLDKYVAPGSKVHILFDPAYVKLTDIEVDDPERLEVGFEQGDTSLAETLHAVLSQHEFDHVILLCYRRGLSIAESDARTLMTLLQLRQMLREEWPDRRVSIVTELLDVGDVELGRVANPDDFIVSEQLVSLILSQLAENPELDPVFADLFDTGDSELILKPLSAYRREAPDESFAGFVAAARGHGEIAIGYKTLSGGRPEVIVNPPKSSLMPSGSDDQLIVLAPE